MGWSADTIVLARPPLSHVPLYYRCRGDRVHVAVVASSLATKGDFDLAGLLANQRSDGGRLRYRTAFAGVAATPPGMALIFGDGGLARRPFLPLEPAPEPLSFEAAATTMRDGLLRSVRRKIGRAQGIASQLSGGRDSSAVTAMAAKLSTPIRQLSAFTYAPIQGAAIAHPVYRFDESEQATAVAVGLPGIDHRFIRPRDCDVSSGLDDRHRFAARPMSGLHNFGWWDDIEAAAVAGGAQILLTGSCGNLTISAGGPRMLNLLFRRGGLRRWWSGARACASYEETSWLSLLDASFGGFLPRSVYAFITKRRHPAAVRGSNPFFLGALAQADQHAIGRDDPRPPADLRRYWRRLLSNGDFADTSGAWRHGVLLCDPTADRALAEMVLGLPSKWLPSRYDRRPLYESAFAQDLPEAVLRPQRRGSQGADWMTAIKRDALMAALDRYALEPCVREWIDLRALRSALAQWPDAMVAESRTDRFFMDRVFPAICLASFLYVHAGGMADATSSEHMAGETDQR